MSIRSVSKRIFTSRWFISGAALVALYSLAGFFLLPYLAKRYLDQYVERRLDHRLILAELRSNPFTFTVEAKQLGITDKNGSPITNLAFFSADFDPLSSVVNRAWTFSYIRMTDPLLHVVLKEEGGSNLSDLLRGLKGDEEPEDGQEDDREMPRVLLEAVILRGGKIDLIDRRRSPPADVLLRSISVDLEELTTLPERTGGYMVSGRTKAGEKLKWRGRVSLNPVRSEGSLRMESVKVATFWEFLKDTFHCEEPPGKLSLQTEYLVDLGGEDPGFVLSSLGFDVSGLAITLRGEQSPFISVERITGRGGRADWNGRVVSLETLSLEGGMVREEADGAGLSRVRRLRAEGERNDPEAAKELGEEEGKTGIPLETWTASLRTFELKGFDIQVTDLTTEPPAIFRLGSLELGLEGLSTDPNVQVDFRLHTRVEDKGEVSASGKAEPWNRRAEGRVEIANFPLVSLQPYLEPRMRLNLESGGVDGQGEFRYGESENGIFTYHGKGNIHTFRAGIGASQPFWEWDSLACDEINLSVSPSVLELGHVRAIKPSGRLLIQEDGTVNLSRIMTVREREQGNTEAPGQPFRFAAERLQVAQGSLDFADLSLTPQFGALIHDLRGTITGISSVSGTLAKVELEGRVDEHGMARITGETDFLKPAGNTDVTMDFRNIEMTNLTPYAIRFAGYRIASGKLDLDLHYRIEDGKMLGRNRIIAQKLTLGELVKSPTALDLPFELAIALLKDSNGVIDIGLPVSGDLDNPQFEFGDVVRKALGNLLKKIATAPFAWLAALVGSERENFDSVSFDPGNAVLLPPAKGNLIELSEALEKRPLLRLRIRGGYAPELDGQALKSLLIRNRVEAKEDRTLKPGEEPGPIIFHRPETQEALEELFLEYSSPDVLEKLRAEYRNKLPAEQRGLDSEQRAAAWADFYRDLYRGIEERIEISGDRIRALAEARALAIKQFLVAERRIDPSRLDVIEPLRTGGSDGKEVKSRLSLDVRRQG
jgi:hypothetical protein